MKTTEKTIVIEQTIDEICEKAKEVLEFKLEELKRLWQEDFAITTFDLAEIFYESAITVLPIEPTTLLGIYALEYDYIDEVYLHLNNKEQRTLITLGGPEYVKRGLKNIIFIYLSNFWKNKLKEMYREIKNTGLINALRQKDMQTAGVFIKDGADVNARCKWDDVVATNAIINHTTDIVDFLIENDIDVEIKNEFDKIEKEFASSITKVLDTFAENNIGLNVRNGDGVTPLVFAIEQDNVKLIKFLIDEGVDVNAKGQNNQTPLMFLAKNGNNATIVKTLINNGADIGVKDDLGKTAYDYAQENLFFQSNSEVINLLTNFN